MPRARASGDSEMTMRRVAPLSGYLGPMGAFIGACAGTGVDSDIIIYVHN